MNNFLDPKSTSLTPKSTPPDPNYIIIMAGGIGSRFWPASREERPKQFLDILGIGKSLLRLTYERFIQLVPAENIYVITNEKYRNLVKQEVPELVHAQILGEPSRNNTAPCIAYAAFKLMGLNPQANLIVAPSDHFIAQETNFLQVVMEGLEFTEKNDAILTLGMRPTRPATGYGYIETGDRYPVSVDRHPIFKVNAFKEKPKFDTAKQYIEAGNYFWNSGLFLFKAAIILEGFKQHASQIFKVLVKGDEHYNTASEQTFLNEWYPKTDSISVDYAIMERATNIFCLPADFGWTDLGSWGSLYEFKEKGDQKNVALNNTLYAYQSRGNLVRTCKSKSVILKNINNFIIIEEEDTLLIYPLEDEQEIKQISNEVQKR